jgi:serine/threonine protein kinase
MSQPNRIGRYQVVEALQTIGKVRSYRALDPLSGRKVALQTVTKDSRDKEAAKLISRFKRQAEVSTNLKHPGIVEIYEYDEDSGTAFVVCEFVEGCNLQPRLRVPILDAGSLVTQLLKALDYAHSQGVLHLNIKPSNLVLTSKGQLKVTNFGGSESGDSDSAYRSPEQIRGTEIDQRTDVFSAGAFFYELITNTPAFPGPPDALADQIRLGSQVPASQAKPSVPGIFDQVCAKSLAKNRSDRPSSAQKFCEEISAAYVEAMGESPRNLVSNETAVSAFLSSMRTESRKSRSKPSAPKSQPAASPKSTGSSSFPVETLRSVEKELAPFLGPLARIVVKEAAMKATDLSMLYELAAESLGNDDDRNGFLARRPGAKKFEASGRSVKDSAEIETATFPDLTSEDLPPVISSSKSGPMNVSPRAAIPDPSILKTPPQKDVHSSQDIRQPNELRPGGRDEGPSRTPDPENLNKPGPETNVVERLENLLGKQPESLAGYLAENPPAVDRVIYAFSASVEALIRLYDANGKTDGLVPQNILFDRMGKASIRVASTTSIRGTIVGAVGSPRYAAPEILAEKSVAADMSPKTADLYALGWMFYEILLGRTSFARAFPNKTDLDWLRWHADTTKAAPTLKSQLADTPTALSDLLELMMEKDLAKRVTDPGMVLSRLKAVAQQASRTVVTPGPVAPRDTPAGEDSAGYEEEKRGNTTGLVIVAVLLLLAALAVVAWRKGIIPKKFFPPRNESSKTITIKPKTSCVLATGSALLSSIVWNMPSL